MRANLTQPIQMTVDELMEGVRAELAVKLFGDDLDTLKAKADEISAVVSAVRGAADVQPDQVTGTPQLRIQPDRAAIARYGLNIEDVQQIIQGIVPGVPLINFATGNTSLLPLLAEGGGSVIGVDWRTRLDDAWQVIGHDRAVQGNLDPCVLFAEPQEIRRRAGEVLAMADKRPGHIFNLGHGVLPQTPVDNAIALVDAVHELSQR